MRNVFRGRQSKNLVAHNRTVFGAISHKLYFITRGPLGEIPARETKKKSEPPMTSIASRFGTLIALSSERERDERATGNRRSADE